MVVILTQAAEQMATILLEWLFPFTFADSKSSCSVSKIHKSRNIKLNWVPIKISLTWIILKLLKVRHINKN